MRPDKYNPFAGAHFIFALFCSVSEHGKNSIFSGHRISLHRCRLLHHINLNLEVILEGQNTNRNITLTYVDAQPEKADQM